MSPLWAVLAVIAVALCGYLVVALTRPEKW